MTEEPITVFCPAGKFRQELQIQVFGPLANKSVVDRLPVEFVFCDPADGDKGIVGAMVKSGIIVMCLDQGVVDADEFALRILRDAGRPIFLIGRIDDFLQWQSLAVQGIFDPGNVVVGLISLGVDFAIERSFADDNSWTVSMPLAGQGGLYVKRFLRDFIEEWLKKEKME